MTGNKITRIRIVLIILAVAVGGWWFYQNKIKGGRLDIPGINIFQNGSPDNESPDGEPLDEQDLIADQVEGEMAAKFNKDPNGVTAEVESYTETYAKGRVSFADEPTGAWWLATKEKGGWRIVTSGNGDVMCREIADYDFPVEMVPVCFDNGTQRLQQR